MNLSEQIIEILNHLADKVGLTVDWTSKNVFPYIQEVMARYRLYSIINCSVLFILGIIFLIISVYLIKKIRIQWNDDATNVINPLLIIGIIIVFPLGLYLSIHNVSLILQWCIIPEVPFLEMIKEFIE